MTLAAMAYFMHPLTHDTTYHSAVRAGVRPGDVVEHLDHTKMTEPAATRGRALTFEAGDKYTNILTLNTTSKGKYDLKIEGLSPTINIRYTYADGKFSFPDLTGVDPIAYTVPPETMHTTGLIQLSTRFKVGDSKTLSVVLSNFSVETNNGTDTEDDPYGSDHIISIKEGTYTVPLSATTTSSSFPLHFDNVTISGDSLNLDLRLDHIIIDGTKKSSQPAGTLDVNMGASDCRTSSVLLTVPCSRVVL
jgi:hypothetical protein